MKSHWNIIRQLLKEFVFVKKLSGIQKPGFSSILTKRKFDSSDVKRILSQNMNLQLISKLGSGNHGTVYLVKSLKVSKSFACKIILFGSEWSETSSESLWRHRKGFTQEVQNLSRIKHANIVNYEGCFQIYSLNDRLVFVDNDELMPRPKYTLLATGLLMEKLDVNLVDWMTQKEMQFLPEEHLINIFLQIGNALAYLHQKHICHHDVKAANIVLARSTNWNQLPQWKLVDFGQSRRHLPEEKEYFDIESLSFGSLLLRLAISGGDMLKREVVNFKSLEFKRILMFLSRIEPNQNHVDIKWALDEYIKSGKM